jgi:type I restriction enzyme S subunit
MSAIPYTALFSNCPESWEVVPLQEHVFFQEGPGILAKDFRSFGVPLLRLAGLGNKFSTLEGCNYLDPEMVEKKWAHFRLNVGDIVTSTSASFGRTSTVDKISEGAVPYTGIIRFRPKTSRIVPGFIELFLQSDFFEEQAGSFAAGSVIQHFGPTHLKQMAIALPPVKEQSTIAAVIGAVDNKIDLLHRQNQTLEAMAETLFRQWFVEGAQKSWEERPLSSIANFLNGLACQKYPPKNEVEKLPVLKIRELSSGVSESSDWATSEVKPEYIVEAGDVIFAWSASLMVKVWDGGQCVLNQHLFKVTSDEFPKWFYLMWCKHHLAEFIAISASHATTMGHIKRGDLDAAMVLVPPPKVLEEMSVQMVPLLHKQIAIAKQRKTLEALRDSLLPKLMSGEVRVAY